MFQVYPFRSTNVQKLDETHKAGRRDFCQWILDKNEDFPDFSDEKRGPGPGATGKTNGTGTGPIPTSQRRTESRAAAS